MTAFDDFQRRIRERQQREEEARERVREVVPQPLVGEEAHRAMPATHCQVSDCALHGRGQHRQIRSAKVDSPDAKPNRQTADNGVGSQPGEPDALGRFAPGNKGGGRPAAARELREWAHKLVTERGRQQLEAMLASSGEDRRFALRLLMEYGYGKPRQAVDIGTDEETGPLQVVVEYVTTAPINSDNQQDESIGE